ncbi:MAG: peptidylprolyl isomerase [Betaproteobacteria bacterium]|nr:peptidylprolyl isomerase [Betaproteobacteria bacterium]
MRTIRIFQIAFALYSGLAALSACNAQQPAAATGTVAKVNGTAIPQSRLELIVRERTSQGQPDSPELRRSVREDLINREILAQEAVRKGLDKNADVAAQVDLARQSVLVRAFLQDHLKANPVSDDALMKDYETIKGQLGNKEYKARHILVDKEEDAKAIIAQIKKGTKFEKLASDKSKDMGSKSKGGELEWSSSGNFVLPFASALTKLQKGQMTQEPVQSQFGWHVIRLDDVRPLKAPSFEEVKPNLAQRVQQQQLEKFISELRAKAKVE